jgi:hypothetical protein
MIDEGVVNARDSLRPTDPWKESDRSAALRDVDDGLSAEGGDKVNSA